MNKSETIIVSVGGSLIVPEEIDIDFLKNLKTFIISQINKGRNFIIIVGGGKTARNYQEAVNSVTHLTEEDLDWLGIHSTRLNAHLLRAIFYKEAHPAIIKNPTEPIKSSKLITIAAGWKPGWSTDYVAIKLAENIGAKRIVNLSNIDYAYTDDPRKNANAKPIEKIDWKSFRAILPEEWSPGLSSPFDPIAAEEAEKLNLEVAIISGNNLSEFEKYLREEPFKGTLIS